MNPQALFLDAVTRGSAVLIVGLGAATLLRRRSAAVRHWVLAAAILCASATPLLSRLVPSWGISRNPGPVAILTTLTDDSVSRALPVPAPGPPFRWERVLAPAWIAGTGVSLLLLAAGFVQLRRVGARATPVASGAWCDAANEVAQAYGLRRSIALLHTDHPSLLVTWGVWRPKVILPLDAPSWPPDRARIVLAHELAHVGRADWAIHIVATLARAAFWFNPLMWIACRRLSDESEQACDDQVLALGIGGSLYAAHLVELARVFKSYRRTGILATPAPAIVKTSSLERRVRAMLQLGLNRNPISRTASVATLVALAAITIPLAGFGAAQTGPATFTGTLVDAIGRILPDVPIELKNAATAATIETRTDASGTFSVANLPAGEYELTASLPGFGGRYRLTLNPGANLPREIPLQLGVVQETISVRRDAPPAPARPPRMPSEYRPESDPCRQSQVGGCLAPPVKLLDVHPVYPASAGDRGATIRLQAVIGTDGLVRAVHGVDVAPADTDFAESAVAAVRQWRFRSTRLDGVAVETQMNVTVRFSAQP